MFYTVTRGSNIMFEKMVGDEVRPFFDQLITTDYGEATEIAGTVYIRVRKIPCYRWWYQIYRGRQPVVPMSCPNVLMS